MTDDADKRRSAVQVGDCVFVVAGCDAAPLFESIEGAFDGVAQAVERAVERGWPPADPLAFRRVIWSVRSGMVCLIFLARKVVRVLGCEYALSPSSRKSRLARPRPGGSRCSRRAAAPVGVVPGLAGGVLTGGCSSRSRRVAM